jgi:Domain of Unknown Function (DUF1080)
MRYPRFRPLAFMALFCWLLYPGQAWHYLHQAPTEDQGAWQKLFDGQTLQGWQLTNFGGQGNVRVEDGTLILEMGSDLTGITWKREFPKMNYEVALEAKRVEGSDFFCGVTFPVGDSFCSLILGGWGGTVVGLSSIDGKDASENSTSRLMNFDLNRWYRVRLRVGEREIEAWIDDQKVVNQELAGHRIGIRPEVDLSRPFGIASWRTEAALRDIRFRSLAANR